MEEDAIDKEYMPRGNFVWLWRGTLIACFKELGRCTVSACSNTQNAAVYKNTVRGTLRLSRFALRASLPFILK